MPDGTTPDFADAKARRRVEVRSTGEVGVLIGITANTRRAKVVLTTPAGRRYAAFHQSDLIVVPTGRRLAPPKEPECPTASTPPLPRSTTVAGTSAPTLASSRPPTASAGSSR